MRNLQLYIIGIAILGVFSCNKLEYEGAPYSKDGYYDMNGIKNAIYFDRDTPADSLVRYSFGTRFDNNLKIDIPVKITGFSSSNSLKFRVSVDTQNSTAKEEENYTPLQAFYEIPKDSLTGTFQIELLRGNLPSDTEETVTLVLDLVDTSELKAVFPDKKKLYIQIDNFLEQPYFWVYYEYYWGPYSQIKYRKFLEYFDNDPKEFESAIADYSRFTEVALKFVKVYDFFKAHPEYNVELPAQLYRPYK